MSELRVPVGIRHVLRHVPVEIDEPSSHHLAALTQCPLGLATAGAQLPPRGRLPGAAYRPSGRHQPVNESARSAFIETWGLPCATACRGQRSSDRLALRMHDTLG